MYSFTGQASYKLGHFRISFQILQVNLTNDFSLDPLLSFMQLILCMYKATVVLTLCLGLHLFFNSLGATSN